ncbi:hypothetical protein [Grimontia marina]|uniref:Uncharacterized protein n=1 Tax=Grimontia marina TaxID=646534 RepID=A0A128EYH8_9GAMM|nr:hypothetical protein [Grimontia marina]CZF79639.1 hypothetical protein GMA8713_01059 [Grimontia marina]
MKTLLKYLLFLFLFLVAAVVGVMVDSHLKKNPDATYELRGRYLPSPDGKTYLVVEDDNGGMCGPLTVNGKEWPHGPYQKAEVTPGDVTIECGSWITVHVQKGTTYYFGYWGP